MDEYIERETFLKEIEERYCLPCKEEGKDYDGCRCRACWVDDMRGDVICAPAADVASVVHGRWVDKPLIKSFKHTNIPVVECSACGIDFCDIINNHYFMYKYCPNCGAKMDGGVEDACL